MTIWTYPNRSQPIALGWEWTLLGDPKSLTIANPETAATNLRFVLPEGFVVPHDEAIWLTAGLILRMNWQAVVADVANLDIERKNLN